MSPYETHKPVLECFLSEFNHRVLELGCGDHSTDLIINKSFYSLSLEDNKDWFEKFKDKNIENHYIEFVNKYDWENHIYCNLHVEYSLTFIDNGVFEHRCLALELVKYASKVVLMHDSFDKHLKICNFDIKNIYKYIVYFYPSEKRVPEEPPTIVLSNFIDVTKYKVDGYVSEIINGSLST